MKGVNLKSLRQIGPVLLILVFFGCAEDIDRFVPDPQIILKGDIDRFFDAARDDISQTTTINIDFPTAVVTPRKTVLIFQPKSLIDAQGNIATGFVDIQILELLTRGEILLYGIPTHSRTRLLSSGGEFYVTASQNGLPLTLRDGMPVRILTDVTGSTPDERMELFYGELEDNDLIDSTYTWFEADNNPDLWSNVDVTEWVALADSQQIITGFGYESFSDSIDWINFDVFINIPQNERTDVCVSLPQEYGNVNTAVFLVFHQRNSVVALSGNAGIKQFCNYYSQYQLIGVPVGEPVTFAVVSEQGESKYFFALVETVLTQDYEISIIPEEAPLEIIKEEINKL
ncbi:MAG TPA: hypothetical protein VI603_14500 [Saprospiraceae bacterium]|nr:hypothetical protein [Saprospiraceae bacterium]